MYNFWIKLLIYFVCFLISMFSLTALDFDRLLKKNASYNGQLLYMVISFIMAYLLGEFLMNIIYVLAV